MAPLECPGLDRWQALLGDTVPAEQRERYERHLESCPVCQERVHGAETIEAERHIGKHLGDPTAVPPDPTLIQVLDRLHSLKSPLSGTQVETADLYFLRPADRADILGTLGDYEVQEVIGQGGMGIVLKAYEPALHRLVAIKVMSAAVAGSATARRRFTREAQAAAAVVHDHVVTVHGVHEKEGLPYLVMQYVSGESLQARLDRAGPLEPAEIVRIALQTAHGLAAAHAQGLIHRDIKPANLLLENGLARVKITDFGLARMVDDVGLTQQGVVAGTPEYMAPEQARGETVDHRADLFSLGSVMYTMCTGVPPFRGANPVALLRHVSDEAPKPVRALNPDIPAWLEALIERLMAKAPGDRVQTAAEVAALLEGYLAHLRQPRTVTAPVLPFMQPKTGIRALWHSGRLVDISLHSLLVLLLLAPAALGLAAWFEPAPDEARKTFSHRFEGNTQQNPDLSWYGPGAHQHLLFEEEGLRISLPAGHPAQRPGVGLATAFGIKGDFEITVGFEMLKAFEPGHATRYTGLNLVVVPESPAGTEPDVWYRLTPRSSSFGYCAAAGRTYFQAGGTSWLPDESKRLNAAAHRQPTTTKKGLLRVVRSGGVISFSASKGVGEDFIFVGEDPDFGDADLKEVRIVATTGGERSWLDARFTELHIHAESLPSLGPQPRQHHLRTGLLIALIAATVVSGPVLLLVRHRRRARLGPLEPEPAPVSTPANTSPVSLMCSGCGKNLKAKAELAGKRVKCPHCGKVTRVPRNQSIARTRSRLWPASLALVPLAAGALGLGLWFAGGSARAASRFQEYHQSLKSVPSDSGLQAIGPDAEECVSFEPEGLRIKLPTDYAGPAGWHGERPDTGIVVPVALKGDFDVAMTFQILHEPAPGDAGTPQTRLSLDAGVDRARNTVTSVSRRVEEVGGRQYVAWMSQWKEDLGQSRQEFREFPARSQAGRLRMVRRGAVVSYYAAEGPDKPFRLLREYPFGAEDVEDIRIVGSTGGPRAALDVRVTDLRIKAETLTDKSQPPWSTERLLWFIALAIVMLLAAGIALALRRRLRPGATI
jgi:serine/threonine protein kinase